MNREWRAKRNHGTTPRPNEKKFFRFRSIDTKKESEEKECSKVTTVKDIFGESDDPYHFASEESNSSQEETDFNPFCFTSEESDSSNEETDANSDSWTTDYREETSSDSRPAEFSSPEIMRCQGNREISPTQYPSTESLIRQCGNPKFASTRYQCTDDDIPFRENSLPSTITEKHHCGNPKFTSTRNQCSDDDIQFSKESLPSTITEMPTKRSETIEDSNDRDLENVSPQIPVGINENYIKSPGWEDFENEVIREREIPLENRSALSDVPNVCTEDLRLVSKLSKEKEKLEMSWDFLQYLKNDSQSQGSQDIYSMTTIDTEDIVDDVFKNSRDTISLKLDDAVLTNPDISLEQQEAEETSMHGSPKRSTVTEKKKLKEKRHLGIKRSHRKKIQVPNLKPSNPSTQFKAQNSPKLSQITKMDIKSAKSWIDKEEYLRTLPVCPLSLPKTPFDDIRRPEYPEEEAHLTEAGTSKRRKKILKTLEEEECSEYEKYLKSVPICPLSLTKFPFSRSRRLEN